jgi:Arc/MetJ-type ribon-helix-helix transcriptional regulator
MDVTDVYRGVDGLLESLPTRLSMSKLTVQLPDSLHRSIKALAEQEGYSVDQFLASAAAEKMAALRTLEYLRNEAANGRREDFDRFLAAVPNHRPSETDHLPD